MDDDWGYPYDLGVSPDLPCDRAWLRVFRQACPRKVFELDIEDTIQVSRRVSRHWRVKIWRDILDHNSWTCLGQKPRFDLPFSKKLAFSGIFQKIVRTSVFRMIVTHHGQVWWRYRIVTTDSNWMFDSVGIFMEEICFLNIRTS